jgi:hypothetical protein
MSKGAKQAAANGYDNDDKGEQDQDALVLGL